MCAYTGLYYIAINCIFLSRFEACAVTVVGRTGSLAGGQSVKLEVPRAALALRAALSWSGIILRAGSVAWSCVETEADLRIDCVGVRNDESDPACPLGRNL